MSDGALQHVLDRQAIHDVQVRYAVALDARDWSLLRSCFVDDVTADYAGLEPIGDYAVLEAVCRRALEPLAASQHLLGNHQATVDGDRATASCYFHAQHVRPGTPGGDLFVVAGTYTDRLRRVGTEWKIAHRVLSVTWTAGNDKVLHG